MRVGTKLTLAVGSVLVAVGLGYGVFYAVMAEEARRVRLAQQGTEVTLLIERMRSADLQPPAIAHILAGVASGLGLDRARLQTGGAEIRLWPPLWDPEVSTGPPTTETTLEDGARLQLWLTPSFGAPDWRAHRNPEPQLVALVTLLLLLAVYLLAHRSVAVPLRRFSRSVEQFGAGDLSLRHRTREGGEIGWLAERFNRMADTIEGQTEALLRDRAYERSIVENISSGIVAFSAEGRITTWNRAMADSFGFAAEEMRGEAVGFLYPRIFGRPVVQAISALLQGERDRFEMNGVRHRTSRASERVLDVRGRALMTEGADGSQRVQGVVLAVDDRTESERLTRQLQHAEKLATVGQLAAGLAHEIGTPLNVISGRAEFALRKLPEGDPLANHLTRIVAQIDRISGIVSQMLVFARRRPPAMERVVLAELVQTVTALLSHQSERSHVEVTVAIDPTISLVADPDQMQQVIMNLLINAQQAIVTHGSITITGSTLCVPEQGSGSYVLLQIADTGPGMPEAVRSQLFDPFFTTKEPGQGTGLGLTVVHGIISAHQGWIQVESIEGEGTTFSLYLPQDEMPGATDGLAADLATDFNPTQESSP